MWGYLAVMVISAVLSVVLAPKQPKPKPSSLSDFDAPRAEEGKPLPVLFGTKILRGPNVLWYGDLRVDEIKEKGGKK